VARALAQRFEYGVHIDADDVGRMVVSGARPPSLAGWSAEARKFDGETDRQLEMRYRVLCAMAKTYAEYGFVVVVDFFFATPWVDFCLDQLDGFIVHLVTLAVPRSIRHERIQTRGTDLPEPGFEDLVESALATEPGEARGLWIDASAEDPEKVVDAIVAQANTSALETYGPELRARLPFTAPPVNRPGAAGGATAAGRRRSAT